MALGGTRWLAFALVALFLGSTCMAVSGGMTLDGAALSAADQAEVVEVAPLVDARMRGTPPVPGMTAPEPRPVVEQPYLPFAGAAGIVLDHPAARVERVGFHQSSIPYAQQLDPMPTAVDPITLGGRHRQSNDRTAVDVVVDPAAEIRSPVNGTVKRAGTYVLYCKYHDDHVVIEPDGRPGWEVKVLHITGVQVQPGDRVVARETVLAPHATQLPFESQIDKLSPFLPAWPHVHIELVHTGIPLVPGATGATGASTTAC